MQGSVIRKLLLCSVAALIFLCQFSRAAQGQARLDPQEAQESWGSGHDRIGSTNVPMDSWVYPALERLSAMGLVPFQSTAIRPWTRQECRRQVQQAREILAGEHGDTYAVNAAIAEEGFPLLRSLDRELREPDEAREAVLESTYLRVGTIAGPALTDGFHFGQTWTNDFGRPLGRGTSTIAGYSVRAIRGRFYFYNRQELQQSPTEPGVNAAQSALFYRLDNYPFNTVQNAPPVPLSQPRAAYVRGRPIELYAGAAFSGYSLLFGKQQMFWGPGVMGPLSFSANAEPTYNLRLVATRPHPFPFAPTLGTYRFDLVFGKLSGHRTPARPYFNGQKLDLTFGSTLEMSVTRWSILWGQGHPMTLHSLKANFLSANSTGTGDFGYGDRSDPGDRKSAFDFRLHVPGLEKYLTLYADSYADDELLPLAAPRRVAWNPGLYMPRIPGVSHMDFRFEATSTEELSQDEGGTRFYINNQYRDGNTNKGFLLGSATGRDARALEGRFGYWLGGETHVQAGYRQTKGGLQFLPGGSTISDLFVEAHIGLQQSFSAEAYVQRERFLIPAFMPGAQFNTSARLQVTWTPQLVLARP